MSVTFSPQLRPTGYRLYCAFDDSLYSEGGPLPEHPLSGGCQMARDFTELVRTQGFEAAYARFGEPVNERYADFDTCLHWGGHLAKTAVYVDDVSVQMSNTNAQRIFEVLGLGEDDWSGEISAEDFLGRVLCAQGLYAGDVGRPAEQVVGERGATLVHAGVEEGYLDNKLEQLRKVAQSAHSQGLTVTWG